MFYHNKGKTNLDPDFELPRTFHSFLFSIMHLILIEKKKTRRSRCVYHF